MNNTVYETENATAATATAGTKHLASLNEVFTFDSTTFVTLPHLEFEIKVGEQWTFEVNLMTNNIEDSLRAKALTPANSTGRLAVINAENSTVRGISINADTVVTVTPGTDDLIQIKGIVTAGENGVVQFQIRNNIVTTPQSFREHSWIEATKIS